MAIRRYRHFWGARLVAANIDQTNTAGVIQPVGAGLYQQDLATSTEAFDLASIIKNYEPPRFMREVREVATGKVVNERILGRMDAPATNFSITLPSEFERLYGYNTDYRFEITEELHDNAGGRLMLLTDLVEGFLFDRESSMYEHGSADRDWTLRFILKKFTRTMKYPQMGDDDNQGTVISSVTNIPNASLTLLDVDMTLANPTVKYHAQYDMFGRNRAIP